MIYIDGRGKQTFRQIAVAVYKVSIAWHQYVGIKLFRSKALEPSKNLLVALCSMDPTCGNKGFY